jgi:hypothetical protein
MAVRGEEVTAASTAAQLRDQAVAYLGATTISYPDWLRRVAAGKYIPSDGSGTNWGRAFAALDQIPDDSPPTPPSTGEGRVRFCEYADARMWTYVPPITPWMQQHWNRVIAYRPSWDPYAKTIPTWCYIDASAIYFTSTGAPQHPEWTLKDANGGYVKFPGWNEYLADVGGSGWRTNLVSAVKAAQTAGYVGVHLDDVNLGHMTASQPAVNPRTGQLYTLTEWRADFATMLEQVRQACPPPFEIVHNSVWWDNSPLSDPSIQRAVKACDIYELERGFSDPGYSAAKIVELFGWIDQVHAWGVNVNHLASPADTLEEATFNLACALLCSDGGDYQYANYKWTPVDWWPLHDTDLGDAKGPRVQIGVNVWQRDFARGYATADLWLKKGSVV